ncbi:fungal-specific transcription factor domain-containing protein [Aspergillus cavernicola]|uniref:Fungal-specific transcription factor domain-containing protein n=1 Tax=Aspergillus cavernicola TaxID=176166 RepID=A0ABR4J1G5_9EURO
MAPPTFIVNLPPSGPGSQARKRNQVTRACNWCRVHRLKCDAEFPCNNCESKGLQCNNDRLSKSLTLPQAHREIEKLKNRVANLEVQLQNERAARPATPRLDTPSTADDSPGYSAADFGHSGSQKVWEGIQISTARSPNKTWYGASSLFFFIGGINRFLTTALKQTHSTRGMLPDSATMLLDGPAAAFDSDQTGQPVALTDDPIRGGESLTSMQEEYFLNLFWESYYPSCPILDECDFKEHYQSLWATSDKERKPSALVDIVLAVCMQYGMARQPGGRQALTAAARGNINDTDSTIAGRWHYRRCLTLLSGETESPTLSTLQVHILCSVYLCYAGFLNMSDNASALAVRTAFMLGMHIEPPQSMPRRERQLRIRVWWTLYALESNRCMKLGRPFTLHESTSSCTLPADDREIAGLSGSSFAPIGAHVTWLTWNLHRVKLLMVARKAYTSFYSKPPDRVTLGDAKPITKAMDAWLKNVPEALKTSRQGGIPFSTDRSPLQIEQFTPVWVQRERLLLELMYHNLCLNLYRSSICFTLAGAPVEITEHPASKCAAHAMALTNIIHQVLDMTSILNGWHEAFQWQWNAAMTLVGFVLAFPRSASTWAARITIDLSVSVFEHFGNSFAVAVNAATIMRDLIKKVDLLTEENLRKGNSTGPELMLPAPALTPNGSTNYETFMNSASSNPIMEWPLNLGGETTAEIGGILGHSIDISAETLTDIDWSNLNGSFFDQWAL